MRRFKRAAIALAVVASVVAPFGLTAHAETEYEWVAGRGSAIVNYCSGKRVAFGEVGSGGFWELYYSPAAGGTNCLKVFNRRGGKVNMFASLQSVPRHPPYRTAQDQGNYWSYAGGAKITGTKGQCVFVTVGYNYVTDTVGEKACG